MLSVRPAVLNAEVAGVAELPAGVRSKPWVAIGL
jgi:hypothetical protein